MGCGHRRSAPGDTPGLLARVSRAGRAAILSAAVLACPAHARADWLVSPFIGGTFAGQTVHLDLEGGAGSSQLVFGASGGWLGDGILGFEADFAYAPRYFERDNRAGLVTNSYLYTLTGNVIVSLPLSVTRESLRPYAVGGLGVVDGHLEEIANIFPELIDLQERPSAAVNIGAGVIGFVSRRTGVRFDLRHVRSLAREESPLTGAQRTKLSFWRITAGVTLRY